MLKAFLLAQAVGLAHASTRSDATIWERQAILMSTTQTTANGNGKREE